MRIDLTTTKNVKLKTAGKYTEEDIEVVSRLQSKSVTPTENPQTVNTDTGFSGIDKVEVGAIPNNYVGSGVTRKSETTYIPTTTNQEIASEQYLTGKQVIKGDSNLVAENIAKGQTIFGVVGTHEGGIIPSGTIEITENGDYNVTNYATANVNVPSKEPLLQEKAVTPTKQEQDVIADVGFNGLSKVKIGAIPSEYIVPSGTLLVSENGKHNVKQYEEVEVEVAGSGGGSVEGITDGLARYMSGDYTLTELTPSDFGDITELKKGAFYFNSTSYQETPTITKITLPNSVSKLGMCCFYGNTVLQEIDTKNITNMGDYCFYNCRGLKKIDISNVSKNGKLPSYLLYYCSGLESIITGQYGDNPYIQPTSYSLYSLRNLKDINNGENILRIISGAYNFVSSYQCAYMCADLNTPVIDVEDYATKWTTSGGGIKYCFYGSKIKNYTFVNATKVENQGGTGYPVSMFSNATIINMYLPKMVAIDNSIFLNGITSLERFYLPVITTMSGAVISPKCKRAIIGNTLPVLSSAMTSNTATIFYVPYTNIEYYSGATNWSTLLLNDGTEETRFIVYGDFDSGDTLPNSSNDGIFTIKWFIDEDCSTEITTSVVESSGTYYGKIFAKTYADVEDVSDITYIAGNTTATTYSLSTTSEVGDTIVAAVITRSDTTVSAGWELVATAPSIDYYGNPQQHLSIYQKTAEATTESITVSQTANNRIYIGLANIKNRDAIEIGAMNTLSEFTANSPVKIQKPTNNPMIYFVGNYLSDTNNTMLSCYGQYNTFDNEADTSDRLHYVMSAKEIGTSFKLTSNIATPYNSLAVELVGKGE